MILSKMLDTHNTFVSLIDVFVFFLIVTPIVLAFPPAVYLLIANYKAFGGGFAGIFGHLPSGMYILTGAIYLFVLAVYGKSRDAETDRCDMRALVIFLCMVLVAVCTVAQLKFHTLTEWYGLFRSLFA